MEDSFVLTLKNRKFSEFYLCYCGYAKCKPLHSFGPAVRPNYLIHLILSGKGYYQIGEIKYELVKGQGFLIEPEVQTFYQADESEPWTYLWIGFNGTRAKEYLADIGLGNGHKIFGCEDTAELTKIFFSIMKKNTYTVENDFYREGFLYTFFGLLSSTMTRESTAREETENLYVRKALEYIQNNYHYGIRVADIADYVGVSRGYLHTLFTNNLNRSPQEYLMNYRISRAQQLLEITDLSVEGVAQSCGYEDPLVFSKLFKKKIGKTPTVYRRENLQQNILKREKNNGCY